MFRLAFSTGWICLLFMLSCTGTYQVSQQAHQSYVMDEQMAGNAKIDSILRPYKASLETEMEKVIGFLDEDIVKERPESTLGNFVADAILDIAEEKSGQDIDFGLPNYGGLRVPYLRKGAITRGGIFELMPFDNILVVVEMKGRSLDTLFNHIIEMGGWPISSGVEVSIDTLEKQHQVLIHGKEIDPDKNYSFCVSDYIANGGDRCSFLIDKPRKELNLLFRDAIMMYVEKQQAAGVKIKGVLEGRMKFME